MNYKTTFKKSKFNVYRIGDSFKCVASCVLHGIDPKDTRLVKKLEKKFRDIKITKSGVSFEVTAFSKCHSNDKANFDPSKGKQLAESRCKKKVFQKAEKIMRCVVDIKDAEFLKAKVSYTEYGFMADTELDHIMTLDGKRIYKIEEISNNILTLRDMEFINEIKESKDLSILAEVKPETIKRFDLRSGEIIYFDPSNTSQDVIFRATSGSLESRRNRFIAKYSNEQ